MSVRFLRTLFLVCMAGLSAQAQSYQTSFSDVKFDRAKGPATLNAGVEVDAASGAASINIPFGPGIGERGLRYRPTLSMRLAPQFSITSSDVNTIVNPNFDDPIWGTSIVDTPYQRGFGSASFFPGTLDLGTMVSTFDRKKTTWSLPGGGGGRALGTLPSTVTPDKVQALLTKFGFSVSDSIGYAPGPTTRTTKTPLIQMGSDGSLVVGIRRAGPSTDITDEVWDDIQSPGSNLYRWDFPRQMVVIQGEVAYQFHYVHHNYLTKTIDYLANSQKTQLYSGHYVITKIRNKLGETLDFTYDTDGVGYTVSWSTAPSVKIKVSVVGTVAPPANQPILSRGDIVLSMATRIRVAYEGLSQPVSSYLLDVSDPTLGGALELAAGGGPDSDGAKSAHGIIDWDGNGFDTAAQSVQPIRVTQEAPKEEILFSYGMTGPSVGWGSFSAGSPIVLNSITFPTRTVSLSWEPYRYRMNYSPEGWGGVVQSSLPGRPATAFGVVRITDFDGVQMRTTRHQRVVPTSNWTTVPGEISPPDQWVDRTFYDAITLPDGSVSVHQFVAPPASNGITGAEGMQNLAFIKTLEREIRYYMPGVDWQADLAVTNPSSSSAYKWVVKDRFDVRTPGSPDGTLTNKSVPYPTRVRTWDKESQLFTAEETTGWDSNAFAWKATHTLSYLTGSPAFTIDYLSLAQQNLAYSTDPSALNPVAHGIYHRTDKTFEPKQTDWIFARVKSERVTTEMDNSGFLAPGVGLPAAEPLVTKTFHADINRVESVEVSNSGAPSVTTGFTFQGTAGLAALELQNAYLQSPGLELDGKLGVSAYGYDGNGFLNSISQKPNAGTTLTVEQTPDELGRPIAQKDMNGTVKSFTWDTAGRISSITSSDGDEPTSIVYNDTDHRGIKVIKGLQVTEYRYNGFGQLTLERRKGPDNLWSHRIHGYDSAGRKTGETVWQSGDGVDHETSWVNPALTRSNTVTTVTAEKTICKKWGFDGDGNSACISWQTIPASTTTTTTAARFIGTSIRYDGRGRVIATQDANSVETITDYFGPTNLPPGVTTYVGPIRKITVGGVQTKWFESDAAGRLVRITTPVTRFADPKKTTASIIENLRTEYRYDGGGRIKEVKQIDGANRAQSRTWGYNPLGWLTNLGQPESGMTTYSRFTVAGKPTVTDYNGRQVTMVPDWMGRPLTVTSADGTVSQSYTYDTATNGKGRVASSMDGSISTAYAYAGQGNRLSSLITTTMVQGTTQSFTQGFTHNTYGDRIGGSTSHAAWTQTYHAAAGLPHELRMGTASVASTPWAYYDPVSWALKSITYGNGAASTFEYGPDQIRLSEVKHLDSQMTVQAYWGYTYDGVGNLVREFDKTRSDGAGSWAFDQYGYDELNRLVSAVVQSPTYGEQLQQFDFDAFGNRTSSNLLRVTGWSGPKGEATSLAYTSSSGLASAQNNQVVNASFTQGTTELLQNRLPAFTSTGVPTGADYDSQGNLTKVFEKPTSVDPVVLTMTYDALGRVLSVSSTKTEVTETYQYTAEGLRTVVQEYSGSTLQKTKVNLYNDLRQLVSQYEKPVAGTLTWKRDILYLGTREAAEIDAAGMHVTQVDHLGSPRVVTGPTGQLEGIQKYLPFGELLEQTQGTYKTSKGYTNHEQTDASGLIYMQARFYMPGYGRFLSTDPALDQHFQDTQSWNIYSYVRNNPIMSTDPTGMLTEDEKKEKKADGTQPGPNDRPMIAANEVLPQPNAQPGTSNTNSCMSCHSTPPPSEISPGAAALSGKKDMSGVGNITTTLESAAPKVIPNVESYIGEKIKGSGTCVDFPRLTVGTPPTGTWKKGPKPDGSTPMGTIVATFFDAGGTKYKSESGKGHVGGWFGQSKSGITLVDQYKGLSEIRLSPIRTGGTRNYNANADNYFIVLFPTK